MGYYIPVEAFTGKAAIIAREFGGELLSEPPASYAEIPPGRALIVVVRSSAHEAATFAYDEDEFNHVLYAARHHDRRHYVLISREDAERASGYVREK